MLTLTQSDVLERIEDWATRLRSLYANVLEWVRDVPQVDQTHESTVRQRSEHPMRQFDVAPRDLPALHLYSCGKKISFVPSALWIVGANGRVNLSINRRMHMLVDAGGQNGQASRWMLVGQTTELSHFDRETFLELLHRELPITSAR